MENNKFEQALTIINEMIEIYEAKQNTVIKNATLEVLLKIREKIKQNDEVVTNRVIILYGPEIERKKQKQNTQNKIEHKYGMLKKYSFLERKSKLNQSDEQMEQECSNHDCENCTRSQACFAERFR